MLWKWMRIDRAQIWTKAALYDMICPVYLDFVKEWQVGCLHIVLESPWLNRSRLIQGCSMCGVQFDGILVSWISILLVERELKPCILWLETFLNDFIKEALGLVNTLWTEFGSCLLSLARFFNLWLFQKDVPVIRPDLFLQKLNGMRTAETRVLVALLHCLLDQSIRHDINVIRLFISWASGLVDECVLLRMLVFLQSIDALVEFQISIDRFRWINNVWLDEQSRCIFITLRSLDMLALQNIHAVISIQGEVWYLFWV